MKTIGIIGGMAWPSSLIYYRAIHEYYKTRTGNGDQTPRLVLIQTDFSIIRQAQKDGKWDEIGEILAAEGTKLKTAGADFFLLACNTVHAADKYIVENVDLPMLHIVDVTARKILAQGYHTIALLGSKYTMTGTYFVNRLQDKYGLEVLVPETKEQDIIHNALFDELVNNIFHPQTRSGFRSIISGLVTRGAEAIVLGCTEFGMLVDAGDSVVPLLDTSIIHAQAAVDFVLNED